MGIAEADCRKRELSQWAMRKRGIARGLIRVTSRDPAEIAGRGLGGCITISTGGSRSRLLGSAALSSISMKLSE
jgi:hypothetical protein